MKKLFLFAAMLIASALGSDLFAQLDATKTYTIANNNDATKFMQDNGTGVVAIGGKNDNSYWKFVPTTNADYYYIQNATTGKYIQGYTAAEQEVTTGDTGVEYYVKADATGTYAGKYRMSCTANSPHDFSANTLGLNWKDNNTVQSFASVAEGNARSAWILTVVATPTPDPGTDPTWDEPAQVDGVYQIGTASELEWYAEYVNSCVAGDTDGNNAKLMSKAVLTADIDLEGITHTPIGKNTTFKFDGEFDGQHHRIKNMIINNTLDNQGFFGCVRGNAIIKNIIIDKSCSITAGNRAAGLIGTLQTAADGKCRILNCVNEANVTSVSGVASGIIGAGQSGYAFFKIHNCVNTGKITGASNNKAAAFNGWGADSGKGNSQVWNCYNLGELSPLDGNNTFFRGSFRSVQNCFDAVTTVYQNGVSAISAEDVANGRLCYLLNQGETEGISFKQQIGVDPYPMPVADGAVVYQVADLDCAGNPKGGVTYSNTDGGSQDDHNYDTATGLCTVCSAPKVDWMSAEADGFFYLGTPAQVEWFSEMVRAGYGAMNAKLTADIDYQGVPDAHRPIGTSGKKYFGHFDGQGHRIKGMVLTTARELDNRGYDGMGFFGSVRGGGTSVDNIYTNEVIIENLIIDSSCSIQHDQNFAAGVVAHINSRNDENSNIIIRNCGNEANVSSTGKNIAGILGCVEATNVGLKLYNLWNKGNITGNAGESAAICAWTGQRNVNGEVDVEGCWNIGEVTGVDGNGYNLIRRNSNIVPRNIVDLCTTNAGNQGKVAVLNTADPIASGELCYLLNGDQSEIVYTQNLGTDEMPVYRNASHSQVYQAGTVDCLGAAVGGVTYNNTSGETIVLPHNINDEIGMCDVCYTQFQEPELVDGWYELKNAGNVEWLSAAVANGGGNLVIKAKLMNDIDFLNRENLHSPIGPSTGTKFKGEFDGQGFRIKNMTIERPSDSNIGFFGFLQGNAATTVKNLIIDSSCTIHGYNRVGGITGSYQNGGSTITIENVVNEATVTAEHQDAGGIFGGHQSGGPTIIIRNVLNTGTITAKNAAPYAGALCCYMQVGGGSKIENFVNLGTVNGHEGGNIGRHNIGDVTNLIDLSDTADKTQGTDSELTTDDIANGKLAYTVGWGQLLGTDAQPSPLNNTEVLYVGDAGYSTFYDASNDWALNGDAQAYIGTINGSSLHLDEIEDIPAGTAVVISGTYYNKVSTTATADATGNVLKGSNGRVGGEGIYALAQKGDPAVVGFYPVAASVTIPEGKAYLEYTGSNPVKVFTFEDDATAIEMVNSQSSMVNGPIFNLAGQRINKMQKGINIANGKKIVVK